MLLLAMLAFQPTLIYGAKKNIASAGKSNRNPASSLNTERKIKSSKHGKRHSSEAFEGPLYSPALSASSKLVLSLGSGDVLVRAARGAAAAASAVDKQNPTPLIATGSSNNGGGGGKRQRAGNGKKSNRNSAVRENRQASSESLSPSNGGRKHLDKKFSLATGLNAGTDQQAGGGGGKGKQQRQMLKSQNHQRKRSGNKAIRDEANAGESDKTPSCRYAKSDWSECDAKTNTRSRTLNLKKGDASCQPVRTMEKKCKKSCRYEKGAWSECINGQMTREDKLKSTGGNESSSSCEAVRSINKKCNPNNNGGAGGSGGKQANGSGKKERKNKDKGSRRNQAAQQQQAHQQQS
uniref:PTN/MK heparin-binding protein family n=1 Tax=Musca domestica TaxID=7370 RepID=T1PG19_MUSDO